MERSHLIGRLFKSLRGSATLVYLRPFTNPSFVLEIHSAENGAGNGIP